MISPPARESLLPFVDQLPVGIQTCTPEGVITLSNAFHCRLHGYEPGELVGRAVWSLIKDAGQRAELPAYLAYLVEEQPEPSAYYCVDLKKDGGEVAVRVDWNYDRSARGEVVGFVCAISERLHLGTYEPTFNDAVKDALASLHRLEALLAGARVRPGQLPSRSHGTLSTREQDVLDRLLLGHNPAKIADGLGISVHTVRNHMKSIYRRFGVHSREELSALFLRDFTESKQ